MIIDGKINFCFVEMNRSVLTLVNRGSAPIFVCCRWKGEKGLPTPSEIAKKPAQFDELTHTGQVGNCVLGDKLWWELFGQQFGLGVCS